MLKGIIFDLDGCLIDSSQVQREALYGSYSIVVGDDKCPTYDEYIRYTGDSVENVLKKLNLPIEMAEHFRRISRDAVNKILVNWDVIELIRKLKDKGFKIAICTGKDHDRTEEILRYYNIFDLFNALVCADDVSNPKPFPDSILQALQILGVEKENAVVVGDGYNDILSAKSAGVRSILSRWYGENDIPKEYDYAVDSVNELKDLLMNM